MKRENTVVTSSFETNLIITIRVGRTNTDRIGFKARLVYKIYRICK